MELIDKRELYAKAMEHESVAMKKVTELAEHGGDVVKDSLRIWSVILAERTAFKFDVADTPAIEAEPVVRCKDCEFYTEEDRWCRRLGLVGAFDQDENDYCSHGERRTDE